jgi:hypothetical protein
VTQQQHVQLGPAHSFSKKEREAFFRLWAIREDLSEKDREFVEGLAAVSRLTPSAGIRLLALERGEHTMRSDNVEAYRAQRDRGRTVAQESLAAKIARRKAEKAARRLAFAALSSAEREAELAKNHTNAEQRRAAFAALSPEQKAERKALLAEERRAHWERGGGA